MGTQSTTEGPAPAVPPSHPRSIAAAFQLEALLEIAAAGAAAGVVEIALDVSSLNLTDPPTLRVLVAVAAALRARNGRLNLIGVTHEHLTEALHAASLNEVFVLWDALRARRTDLGDATAGAGTAAAAPEPITPTLAAS